MSQPTPRVDITIHGRKIKLDRYGVTGDRMGMYVVESEIPGVLYFCDGDEMAIVTAWGKARMKQKDARRMSNEILDIVQDLRDLGRSKG